ncbi:aromatic acid exporter family protein [Brevibacillus humidisoli]|uniref:aromatic acid exporter family protein n=1 Tax=Brevibacillus humidisoli TaxID=2895522 RepID=UPI001E5F3759|nr:aromatic acid exporter family protein [Brevibacillus humidisoli]UFJ42253.1 aromatic acid exporter family protein [Brevibacillus humidisoli]
MKIGYRTIKTAVGTALSIFIAQQAGLTFYAAAGIITILCVQVTRKKSIVTAIHRLFACLLGLVIGVLFFEGLGYHPYTFGLLLLVFIPLIVRLKVNEGFVTSAVVLLHIYSLERVDLAIIANELALLSIGIGVALLMNLHMPSAEKELQRLQQQVERNFATVLREFCYYLRNGSSDWDGREMLETVQLLEQAIRLSVQDVENRLIKPEDEYYQYFTMRAKQFELLERMLPIVSSLDQQVPQGGQIADFLDHLSQSIHPGNTAYLFLDKLNEMRKELQQSPLPKTREEFETRASLFYLLREIEQYLHIKHELGREERAGNHHRAGGNLEKETS